MARYQLKGHNIRALVQAAAQHGYLRAVEPRASAALRAALRDPPPASSWVDGHVSGELSALVLEIHGADAVRTMGMDAGRAGPVAVLRPFAEAMLRLFGATPATLLSRLGSLTAQSTRGTEYRYEALSPTSGKLTVRADEMGTYVRPLMLSIEGSLGVVYEVCGVTGVTEVLGVRAEGDTAVGEFLLRW